MGEYFPILFAGGLIGVFSLFFIVAYLLVKNKKEAMGFDRHMADSEIIRRLAKYAMPYKKDFILVLVIMLVSIVYDLVSPLLVGYIEELVWYSTWLMISFSGFLTVRVEKESSVA